MIFPHSPTDCLPTQVRWTRHVSASHLHGCLQTSTALCYTGPASPERLLHGVGAQVDDLHQVVSGAGEQLGAIVVQIQRRHSAEQLQLPHDALRPDLTHTRRPSVSSP